MTDMELYERCVLFGHQTLEARRRFLGLLPEVFQRGLYLKKGFGSIHEFAQKLAGVSRDQVDVVLNLEKRFADRPVLKEALSAGEASVNKLRRVVTIATPENQEEILEKAKLLSNRALETWVRDVRREEDESRGCNHLSAPEQTQTKNRLFEPKTNTKSGHVPTFGMGVSGHLPTSGGGTARHLPTFSATSATLTLAQDVRDELEKLQEKGIDINEFLREALKKRAEEIAHEKEELAQAQTPTSSRYVSTKIKQVIRKEHGNKCAIEGCTHPAQQLHHQLPFALSRSHNPNHLLPLCKAHHEIAHTINVKSCELRRR